MEIWPDIRAAPAASLAGEAHLEIGQPNVIRPWVAADSSRMAAPKIRPIDQEAADAGPHFREGDFLAGELGHGP